jgi:hypothetical protein
MKQLLIHSLEQPAFLSAIIFELRKNINGSYFVKLLLKNNSLNSSIKLEPVKIKGIIKIIIITRKNLIKKLKIRM